MQSIDPIIFFSVCYLNLFSKGCIKCSISPLASCQAGVSFGSLNEILINKSFNSLNVTRGPIKLLTARGNPH